MDGEAEKARCTKQNYLLGIFPLSMWHYGLEARLQQITSNAYPLKPPRYSLPPAGHKPYQPPAFPYSQTHHNTHQKPYSSLMTAVRCI